MPRNGSGTYSLPAGNPVVTGTTISSTVHNNTMTDIGSEITNSLDKDGQTVVAGTIDFNANKIVLDGDGDTSIHASTDDVIDVEIEGADAIKLGWQSVADTGFVTVDPNAFTADATENTHRLAVLNTNAITVPTGTTALASSVYITEPNITATGTVTEAATVYIAGAPTEGASNYSLFVDEGNVRLDGELDVTGTTNLDVVDIDGAVNMATTLIVTGNVDFDGDLDVDGTTNLDVVDIDGAVDMASTLQVDGIATFTGQITANGGMEFLDNNKLTFGTGDDLEIYHDGSNSYIKDVGTGNLKIQGANVEILTAGGTKYADFAANVSRLYHTGNAKLSTSTSGITVTGEMAVGTLVAGSGSITDTSGAISFGDENLSTTGTLDSGALDVTGNITATGNTTSTYFHATSTAVVATDGNGYLVRSPSNGANVYGFGTSYDSALSNRNGSVGIGVVANTQNVEVKGNLSNSGTFISSGGTALATAATLNTPDSALCPTLTITRNGGGTSTNDLYRGANSGGTVFSVDAHGGINGWYLNASGEITVTGGGTVALSGEGKYAATATYGAQILGRGSSYDVTLSSYQGAVALYVPTNTQNVVVNGSLSKGSGSFRIDHPLKPETHELVHSFTESPQADLLYSGVSALVDGAASVNLDEFHGMTEGTFVALNRNIRVFTTNETDWEPIKGSVTGNILSISCQDASCSDTVSWMVIGERHDQHMMETDWTDEQGQVIVEPLKPETPAPVQRTIKVPVMVDGEQATALETVDVPESIEVIDGIAVLTPATTEEVLKPQFEEIGVVDLDGNPVYS